MAGVAPWGRMTEQRRRKKTWLCAYGNRADAWSQPSGQGRWQKWDREPCYFFPRNQCRYGSNCYFRHDSQQWGRDGGRGAGREGGSGSGWWEDPREQSEQQSWQQSWQPEPCQLYQLGCCWFDRGCYYAHVWAPKEEMSKTSLCAAFTHSGSCPNQDCKDAHGKDELRMPKMYEGLPGYKSCLCTYHLVDGAECKEDPPFCFDAHGQLDLRRLPLTLPDALHGQSFTYADSHVHLDHVLLSRKYGTYWFYKADMCSRGKECPFAEKCMFAHDQSARQARPLELRDLEEWAAEIDNVPGSFWGCVHNCCTAEGIDLTLRLVEWGRQALRGRVFASFGIHPSNFEEYTPEVEAKLLAALDACGANGIAWGECGLDYYRRSEDIKRDPTVATRMKEAFAKQAQVAVRRKLTLVVHSRDAEADTMEVLKENVPSTHPVHLHSFMGSIQMVEEFLEKWPLGCVGFAGAVTYEGSLYEGGLGDLAKAVPLTRILLETDGPYMAPNPYRGEESHPGHIPWIAVGIARLKGVGVAEALAVTHQNFCRVYQVDAS